MSGWDDLDIDALVADLPSVDDLLDLLDIDALLDVGEP